MTVVRRTPLLCGPVSNGYVSRSVAMEMARQQVRGRGPVGSRGCPVILPVGTSAGRLPQSATLAGRLNNIAPPRGPWQDTMLAGTRRMGDFREMGLRGFTDEGGGILSFDTAASGRRVGETWTAPPGTNITGIEVISGQGAGLGRKAGALTQASIGPGNVIQFTPNSVSVSWGWIGKVKLLTAAASTGPDAEGQMLDAATNTLKTFNQQPEAGQISPDSALPAGIGNLPAPANAANQGRYDAYRFQLDRVATSRTLGRWAWDIAHPPSSGTGSGTGTTTGTGTGTGSTTTSPPPSGLEPGVTPVPLTPPSEGYDIYGPGSGGQDTLVPKTGGTTIVAAPGSRPPAASAAQPAPKKAASRGMILAGVALLALGGYAVVRHRKRGAHK